MCKRGTCALCWLIKALSKDLPNEQPALTRLFLAHSNSLCVRVRKSFVNRALEQSADSLIFAEQTQVHAAHLRSQHQLHCHESKRVSVHEPRGLPCPDALLPLRVVQILQAAIRDPDPVVFLENELLYGVSFPVRDEVWDKDFMISLSKAKVMREGTDVTLVAFSKMVRFQALLQCMQRRCQD
jgi:pyruvate/2-oxoglutarate/acetoin dehydrogenase E1 component